MTGADSGNDGCRGVGGWVSLGCAGWLIMVATLACWSSVPMLVGWQPVVVMSGSMAPALRPGDIAMVDPRDRSPGVGQIVVVRDPEVAGGLLTHRVADVAAGVLTTKGDANAEPDRRRSMPGDVVGVVRIVVPGGGWLALLVRSPGWPGALWAATTLAALLGVRIGPVSLPGRRGRSRRPERERRSRRR